jgi:hypothetical protein
MELLNPDAFYIRALRYVRREYPGSMAWARKLRTKTFLRMKSTTFLPEYVWVVYASGFRVAVVQSKFPALRKAFADFNLKRLARMRNPRAALRIIANKRKAGCVLRGAQAITAEGFAQFKRRILQEGAPALVALPGIGPITKDHLARNIGLASVAKDDLHIQRVRRLFRCNNKDTFARHLASRFGHPERLVDLVIWQYCADRAWRGDGFESLDAACRSKRA